MNTDYRWSDCLNLPSVSNLDRKVVLIGALAGEGIGPEVIAASVKVLHSVSAATDTVFEIRYGGAIGRDAERANGEPLTPAVIDFCNDIFHRGGVILNGPGGGRFVYDLRREFDLFFKISPIQISNGLPSASRLHADALRGVDILVTREGKGGAYQGSWNEQRDAGGQRTANQIISYSESDVRRFLEASARLAQVRRGKLSVVWKESGVPSISALWRDLAEETAADHGIECCLVDIDLMAYRLIQDASTFDVIAAPNLFGDVLADLGAVILGSRGVSYSGNFNQSGHAVYQTNHGAAYDLAGTDTANPVGQILSVAMMLRESFCLPVAAAAIEEAMRVVWDAGYVTADLETAGDTLIGTQKMGTLIAGHVEQILGNSNVD